MLVKVTPDSAGVPANMTVTGQNPVFSRYDNANRLTNVTQGRSTASLFYDGSGRDQLTTGAALTNNSKFTAREDDGTGLYYYRARYYHPALGRFEGEDWFDFVDGPVFFVYARNDPISASDPLGLNAWDYIPIIGTIRNIFITPKGAITNDYIDCQPGPGKKCDSSEQCQQCVESLAFTYTAQYNASGIGRGLVEIVGGGVAELIPHPAARIGGAVLIVDGLVNTGVTIYKQGDIGKTGSRAMIIICGTK